MTSTKKKHTLYWLQNFWDVSPRNPGTGYMFTMLHHYLLLLCHRSKQLLPSTCRSRSFSQPGTWAKNNATQFTTQISIFIKHQEIGNHTTKIIPEL